MSLLNIFGRKNNKALDAMDIKFHHEANFFGSHGRIVVSHREKQLEEASVPFVFVGLTTPPDLTPGLMNYIWEQAMNQGYIPVKITSYGRKNEKPMVDFQDELQEVDATRIPAANRKAAGQNFLHAVETSQVLPGTVEQIPAAEQLTAVGNSGLFRSARTGEKVNPDLPNVGFAR